MSHRVVTVATALAACFVVSCRVPGAYREQADRVTYDIIEQAQRQALGRTESMQIETPAQTLRRRLLLDQELPIADPASLGTHDIERIRQWPDDEYLDVEERTNAFADSIETAECLRLTLTDALQIAAFSSREYQAEKEAVFESALQLDLERDAFRKTWAGVLEGLYQTDLEQEVAIDDKGHTDRQPVSHLQYGGTLDVTKRFKNGITMTGLIGLDLVSLLTQNRLYSRGVFADGSISIPLLRGAGTFIVTEPLTQAERNVIYAIYNFERFKHEFVVQIASDYLGVLQQGDQIRNAEENYRNLIASTRRARRLADAGRLPEIQVDQSRQDELNARIRWVSSIEAYDRRLDAFKLQLGLPVDAAIELERSELDDLSQRMADLLPTPEQLMAQEQEAEAVPPADAPVELVPPGEGVAGPYEIDPVEAVLIALENRVDLRVAVGQVFDAQRTVAVSADQLRADLTLLGSASIGERRTIGSEGLEDSILRPDEGTYSALLTLDLPLERTAERNQYRLSLIQLEQAVRAAQAFEDQVKLDVRNRLSELLESREAIRIQAAAVVVARRRVESTNLFLEAGRAEIRDVLEAQESLLAAQNALTSALVDYRIGELALQRDLGVLMVDETGLWAEYQPETEGQQNGPQNP